jgi:hypothetical protein
MRVRVGKPRLAAEPRRASARIADLRSAFFEPKSIADLRSAFFEPKNGVRRTPMLCPPGGEGI